MISLKKLAASVLMALIASLVLFPIIASAQYNNPEYNEIDSFVTDLNAIRAKSNVLGVLYFTPFGSQDSNFGKYALSDQQLEKICGGKSCGTFGANFGTYYKSGNYAKAKEWGMNYTLEIVRQNNAGEASNVAGVIANEGIGNVIVRIGITDGGAPGFNPTGGTKAEIEAAAKKYTDFLGQVTSKAGGKEFWAIAGPNEPDIETWAAPGCPSPPGGSDDDAKKIAFYDCTGQKLAWYMNAVIANKPAGVKLLSPAFNMTSFMFNDKGNGILQSMRSSGAQFGQIDAFAGNLYPAAKSLNKYWTDQAVDTVFSGKPIIITETGFNAGGMDSAEDSEEGYDLSMFNEYDADNDDWYIHPIDGIGEDSVSVNGDLIPDNMRTHYIRDDLIRQGYEAHCASPGFKIKMTKAGDKWMTRFLDPANDDKWPSQDLPGVVLGGAGHFFDNISLRGEGNPLTSQLTIDYKDAKTPIFRDIDSKQWLMASLEEYFGFKDTVTGNNTSGSNAELNSAASNSLLSRTQRCVQAATSLYQQDQMCKKLDDPDSCTLYDRKIPETDYDIKQVLAELGAYHIKTMNALGKNDDVGLTCSTLMGADKSALSPTEQKMRTAVEYMPLTIDRSYRFAFLVTNIHLRGGTPKTMFNFFTKPSAGSIPDVPLPKDETIVVGFKIPDITTNKGTITQDAVGSGLGVGASENVAYYDTSKITRDSLLTKAQTKDTDDNGEKARNALFLKAKTAYDPRAGGLPQSEGNSEIFCSLVPDPDVLGTTGQNSYACRDPLGKALVDLINAQYLLNDDEEAYNELTPNAPFDYEHARLQSCDPDMEMQVEPATEVKDPAALYGTGESTPANLTNPQNVFDVEHGAEILEKLMTTVTNMREQDGCGDGSNIDPSFASTEKAGCTGIDLGGGGKENWGLKTLFRVTPDQMLDDGWPYDDERDQIKVTQYLVYPEGYDLKMLEQVLASTFFSTNQKEELEKEGAQKVTAESFDRIEIIDDKNTFVGASASKTYDDNIHFESDPYNDPPRSNDADDYECFDPHTDQAYDAFGNEVGGPRTYFTGKKCERTFGVSIGFATPVEKAKILGGKLGYWMRTMQKSLHTLSSVPRQYLEGCKSTEEFLLGRCGLEPIELAGSAEPPLLAGGMCGMKEIRVSNSSANFTITNADGDDELKLGDNGYFIDPTSQYSMSLATRYVDGATTVLLDRVVPINPNTCNFTTNNMTEVWYLPESNDFEQDGNRIIDEQYWKKYAYKMTLSDPARINAVYDLKVKPGYYYIHLRHTPCIMKNQVWITEDGEEVNNGNDIDRIVYIGNNNTNSSDSITEKTHFCAKVNLQTAMDGGSGENQMEGEVGTNKAEQCTLDPKYPVWANNSCGGRGGNSGDEDDGKFWKDADKPGAGTYQDLIGREFVVPTGDDFECDNLFPNVIREYSCAGRAIDNTDLPANVPPGDVVYNTGISLSDIPYEGRTPLPAVGRGTGYGGGIMNMVWNYRTIDARQIDTSVYNLKTCEVPGATFFDAKQKAIQLNNGVNAGYGPYTGCAAMLRLGDVPFYPNTGKPPRTVWATDMETGLTQGPLLIIDVAAGHDLSTIETEHQGRWLIDLDRQTIERFGRGLNPLDIKVCETPNCPK